MKKEIAEAWVADLRTNPPKTTRRLFDGNGYCCLGRLALVLGCDFTRVGEDYCPRLNGETLQVEAYLSQELMGLSGMKSRNGVVEEIGGPDDVVLAQLNDDGVSFAEIADVIEKHWEKL